MEKDVWTDGKETERQALIEALYRKERKGFFAFAAQWNFSEEEVADLYQDAMVAYIENLRKQQLQLHSSTPSTYLYAIGKYMAFRRLKNKAKAPLALETEVLPEDIIWQHLDTEAQEEQVQLLQRAIAQLGEQCKKLLMLFYYEGKKLNTILQETSYENKDVVKSQKSRCLKQLKHMIKTNRL